MGNHCPAQKRAEAAAAAAAAAEAKKKAEEEAERINREARVQRENDARKKFESAKSNWDQAWQLENDGNSEGADRLFNLARQLITEATSLHPENSRYRTFLNLVGYKLKGNNYFNEGWKLQQKANELKAAGKYADASKMYMMAAEQFRFGASQDRSEAHHFNHAISFVGESLDTVKEAIDGLQRSQRVQVLQNLRKIVNERAGHTVVQEDVSIDIVFQYLKDGHV